MVEQETSNQSKQSEKIVDFSQVKKRISELEEELSVLKKMDKVGDEFFQWKKKK